MGWQPIETVPMPDKDGYGPRVLIYSKQDGVCEAKAYRDGDYHDPVYFEWTGKGATHWMPLPEPP